VQIIPGLGNSVIFNGSIADDSAASIGLQGGVDANSLYQVGDGAGLSIGTGLVVFNGANTYTGVTTLNEGGVLQAVDGVGVHSHSKILFNGGVFQSSGNFVRGTGADNTQVEWLGSGGFSASGAPLTVSLFGTSNPKLVWNTDGFVKNGSSLLFGSESATDATTFTNDIDLGVLGNEANISVTAGIDQSATAILTGKLSGSGALSVNKSGDLQPGVLVLTNASSYTGGTKINAGVLRLENAGALPTTGIVTVDGELDLSDAGTGVAGTGDRTIGGLAGAADGVVSMGSTVLTIDQPLNTTLNTTFNGRLLDGGIAGGAGASLVKTGAGILTLNGHNSYTGSTTVSAGILQGVASAFPGGNPIIYGGLVLGESSSLASRVLTVDLNSGFTAENGALIPQDTVFTLNGYALFRSPFVQVESLNGAGYLALSSTEFVVSGGIFAGSVFQLGDNASSLSKEGDGTLTLSGQVQITGPVAVNAGTFELVGSGTLNATKLIAAEGVVATTGAGTTLTNDSFEKAGVGVLSVSGALNARDLKVSAGTLVLKGGNAVLNPAATLLLQPDATLNIPDAGTKTITTLNAVGGNLIGAGTLTAATYNLAAQGTVTQALRLGSGAVNVLGVVNSTAGIGAQFLTIGSAGTLNLGVGSFVNPVVDVVVGALASETGATLRFNGITGGVEIGKLRGYGLLFMGNTQLTINQGVDTTFNGRLLDGDGVGLTGASLVKKGAGILTLAGKNTYTGATTLTGAGSGLVLLATGSLASNVINVGTLTSFLALNGASIPSDTALTLDGTASLLSPDVTIKSLYGAGVLTLNSTRFVVSGGTFSGNILQNGTSSLTKNGADVLTLSGQVSLTGDVSVNGGLLRLLNGGTLNTPKLIVADTASAIAFEGATLTNPNFEKAGLGMFEVGGTVSAGNVRVSGGTLLLRAAALLNPAATLSVGAGSTLSIPTAVTKNVDIVNVNGGNLTGAGTLVANTYTMAGAVKLDLAIGGGALNISGNVDSTKAIGANSISITTGGTLTLGLGSSLNSAVSVNVDGTSRLNLIGIEGTSGKVRIATLTGSGTVLQKTATLEVGSGTFTGKMDVDPSLVTAGSVQVNVTGRFGMTGSVEAPVIVEAAGDLTLGGTASAVLNDTLEVKGNATTKVLSGYTVAGAVTNAGSLSNAGLINAGTAGVNNANTGLISNSGTISGIVTNAGTLSNTNSGGITGSVVNSGSLTNNGVINGGVTNSGVLSGTGAVTGSVRVTRGGVFRPGNSPGTFPVGGNLDLDQALVYIELGGTALGEFDKIKMTEKGVVNISGGTLNVFTYPVVGGTAQFSVSRGNRFKVLDTADGNIKGAFANVSRNGAAAPGAAAPTTGVVLNLWSGELVGTGLAWPISVGASNWDISADLIHSDLGGWAGLNANQKAMLTQLNVAERQFRGGDLVPLVLGAANAAQAQLVLDKASPEAFAGLADFGLHVGRTQMTQARSMATTAVEGRLGVFTGWTNFTGGSSSSLNRADYDLSNNSAILGLRYSLGGGLEGNAFVTQGTGTVRSTFVNTNVDLTTFGIGAAYIADKDAVWSFHTGLMYGTYTGEGHREANAGLTRFTSADASTFRAALGSSAKVLKRDKLSLTADVGFEYASASVDAFSETGPSGENLSIHSQSPKSLLANVGMNALYQANEKWSVNGRVSAEFDFEKTKRNVSANVVGETTDFIVESKGMGGAYFGADLGTRYDVTKRLSVSASFKAMFGKDSQMNRSTFVGASYGF